MARLAKQDEFEWTQDDVERLVARMEPRLRAAFLRAVLIARDRRSLEALARAAIEGRLAELIDEFAGTAGEALADAANAVVVDAGESVAEAMTEGLDVVVSFNGVNRRAVEAMEQNRLRLVREFTAEQRAATRAAILEGVRLGQNPREQARAFRASIGLTARQQRAVDNFRRLLRQGSAEALRRELRDRRFDPTVRRAVAGETVLTEAQIERMTARYRERYLRFRSEVVARTEALRSAHQGTEEAFRQAVESGNVDGDSLTRTWRTARDPRVRDQHAAMEGQQRPLGEPFVSGNGNALRFPGDPEAPGSETVQCRCSIATRVARVPLPEVA